MPPSAVQISAYPPLAPLVLVLKVYLRSCGLNEVANGGLSSFSLTNMVLAHLMDELRVSKHLYAAWCLPGYGVLCMICLGQPPAGAANYVETAASGSGKLV